MKIRPSLVVNVTLLAVALLLPPPATAQAVPGIPPGMQQVWLALLVRGPASTADGRPESDRLQQGHIAHLDALARGGHALVMGPFLDEGSIEGLVVLKAGSREQAQELMSTDPAAKAGRLVVELHPWWVANDAFRHPLAPFRQTLYFFAFLVRGPKWTPGETPELKRLQDAHLANIRRLAAAGALVVAGPFSDEGWLRGVFVFKTATLEEAKALADTDPAVQAGRLALEFHLWLLPEGSLP